MVVRCGRDAGLDILNLPPNFVVLFEQRPEVGAGCFECVNGVGVAGEFFGEGVVEMFWLHDRTKALPLRSWLP